MKAKTMYNLNRRNLPVTYTNDKDDEDGIKININQFLGLDRRGSTAFSHFRRTMANKFTKDVKYEHDTFPAQSNR